MAAFVLAWSGRHAKALACDRWQAGDDYNQAKGQSMTHSCILYPKRNEASMRPIPLALPCFYANIPYLTFAYLTLF
ncbi:hypothetical protein TKWG_15340 [Advenella kashmirensis WT001]|uniref:Uncharacterized protein n=1 Tax=Advenella kashmirensis (strain DSM 17095 / LMG 22695 / WT001) TaxID=1036672 RepID=I3UDJ0_ADVKW|nr:hypothetical protein TKWG_15340 [Advenella kashmirensis WT001]